MLVFSLIVATIALAIAAALFEFLREKGIFAKAAVPLLAALFGEFVAVAMSSLYLFLLCPVLLITGFVCLAGKTRTATFVACSAVLVLMFTALLGANNVREWDAVRRQYPLESLADRLAYETNHAVAEGEAVDASHDTAEGAAEPEALDDTAGDFYASMRTQSLAYAHASQVEQFIDSPGFGVGRMIRPAPDYVKLPKFAREQSSDLHLESPPSTNSETPRLFDSPMAAEERKDLKLGPLHRDSLVDFVNRQNYGWVKNLREVAGFEPHGFSKLPRLEPLSRRGIERWRTTRLELVSLLKHEEPMVYVSDRLPRMDELKDAPVRALDPFERQGLSKLKQGEALVIDAALNRLRMLGPIYALTQCQQCHQVRRGQLLGAFSYEFMRDPPREPDQRAGEPAASEL